MRFLARAQAPAGISHDPADAAQWTHRTTMIYYPMIKSKILSIIDEDKKHYPFLKQWVGMEVDIDCQWSINNGVLGLDMALHNADKNRFEYCIKMKPAEAQHILDTPHNLVGITNQDKRLIYGFKPLMLPQLAEMIETKKYGDAAVRKKNFGNSMRGWQLD